MEKLLDEGPEDNSNQENNKIYLFLENDKLLKSDILLNKL